VRGLEHVPAVYDAASSLLDRGLLGSWRRSLAGTGEGPLLEVGCGTGRTLALHARTRHPVVGLDPDLHVLRAARRRAPDALLVQARAEALPFRHDSFHTVVSSLVFCSVDDPRAGLHEVSRVLAAGGRLRMLEHVRPRSRFGAAVSRLLTPPWRWLLGGCRLNRDTERTVRESGFQVVPGSLRSRWILRRFDAVPATTDARTPESP
jgi:ubiquinone/menaquinone biosynthesis C-methylase UbiE